MREKDYSGLFILLGVIGAGLFVLGIINESFMFYLMGGIIVVIASILRLWK